MATDRTEELIEREVSRRVGQKTRALHDDIAELQDIIRDCRNRLVSQNDELKRLKANPLSFGKLVRVHPHPNPEAFCRNDEVMVCDPESPHHLSCGKVACEGVDEDGCVDVELLDGNVETFAVGLEGMSPAQVRLTAKLDGTHAVVNIDGKAWEVQGVPDLNIQVGDTVKIHPDSKAIVSGAIPLDAGPICKVTAVLEDGLEVTNKGNVAFVYNPRAIEVEENDRVVCDKDMFCVLKKLPRDARDRYKVSSDLNVTWDDVGGLELAKQDLKDALELPFQEPELFEYYGVDPLRGILLYGPPGCGKTLLARVSVWSMAQVHGTEIMDSAYIFVKGPEILDKWVGNTEAEIRNLFERGRRHYREHGYKAILAIDEADAILPQRGTRRSSDVSDTIVPMFLGEMDGIDDQQTRENPLVILMTNRADILDPAVTRPGRISKHIKIARPDETNAIDILEIHTKNMPFKEGEDKMSVLAIAAADIFSKSRELYRVNGEHTFGLANAVNGAMLASLAESAKMIALHRDLAEGTRTGVTVGDFRESVKKIYSQQRGINHAYDLQDFAESLGIQPQNMQVERCFGAA
jgi:proteasome-associated ATPase